MNGDEKRRMSAMSELKGSAEYVMSHHLRTCIARNHNIWIWWSRANDDKHEISYESSFGDKIVLKLYLYYIGVNKPNITIDIDQNIL